MADRKRFSPLYAAFLALMILLLLAGVFILVYGSLHNGVPVPTLPGDALHALMLPHE